MLLTILFVLIALLVIAVAVIIFIERNRRVPGAERKWTDPKFHD